MKLKVKFCDFWPEFERDNVLLNFLEKHYNILIDDKPDYLFYSVYGNEHLHYDDCIKILFTGENTVPDFNLCDYALGFHYLDFEDRYIRFPIYVYYQFHYLNYFNAQNINKNKFGVLEDELHKRKFCNFVYSNNTNSDPLRKLFFTELSKYKKVDSGGRYLNNIGLPVVSKMDFIKNYKFTIAFENSCVNGYSTEKLIEPILMRSMPIYYGNPLVGKDFNLDSFVFIHGLRDFDRAINEIISLDRDDDLYVKKMSLTSFNKGNTLVDWENNLISFFNNIFHQPLSDAFRRAKFGFSKVYLEEQKLQAGILKKKKASSHMKYTIKNFFRFKRVDSSK